MGCGASAPAPVSPGGPSGGAGGGAGPGPGPGAGAGAGPGAGAASGSPLRTAWGADSGPSDEEAADVLTFARDILGMDPAADADLLWVAEQALAAPVPANWEEHVDEASGAPYYANALTGVSSWEHPHLESFRSLYAQLRGEREMAVWRASQPIKPGARGGDGGAAGMSPLAREEEGGEGGEEAGGASDASCMSSSLERLLEDSGLSTLTADFGISLRSVEYQSGSLSFTQSALLAALRRGRA